MEISTIDERGGYFYEALLNYSIRNYCRSIDAFETHKKLTEHSVVSDVIIPTASSPEAVILCTHSQSEKGTAMKTWRNIDEMLLIRESFPSCKIVNLLFPSKWKRELVLLMNEICDYQIVFPKEIADNISRLTQTALKSKMKSSEEYSSWLHANGGEDAAGIASYLGHVIEYAFSDQCVIRPEWRGFSESIPRSQKAVLHYHSDCLWKKGCGKIALIDPELRSRLLNSKRDVAKLSSTDIEQLKSLGILIERIAIHRELVLDENVGHVLQHDNEIINKTFSLIQQYHQHDLQELTTMINPTHTLSLKDFVDSIPFDDQDRMAAFFFEKLVEWRDFHPGERNVPLSYLYVIVRSINKRFSHEYLSTYCHLPMIGGISPIPQFLYGNRNLPDETIR